eukprot:2786821-Amphidinium_carterae.1
MVLGRFKLSRFKKYILNNGCLEARTIDIFQQFQQKKAFDSAALYFVRSSYHAGVVQDHR